jgi:serine/threonine protein kinase/DNA-binding winged helix-turn-helix (wHTH) protein/tetratricopeptide (TPR) repeat protein
MPYTQPVRVRVGVFELDLGAGELRALGGNGSAARIVLSQQPLQVLSILVERAGQLVPREEIQKKLWPNDTVVEFEHSINAAIAKLRKAFGDSATEPRYIETIAKRGYRLIAPTEWLTGSGESALAAIVSGGNGAAVQMQPESPGLTGRVVSHYRVLEIVGGGGMGVVYRAEDLKLGRQVALKFLPEEVGGDPAALERFEREARAASALDHPNICSIYEFGEHEGQPFIVMQLLEGETLREHLSSAALAEPTCQLDASPPFLLDHLLDIACQIADGLQAAHERGIVHRDIKPANIFLTRRGMVKILDFGVAKLVKAAEGEAPAVKPSDAGPAKDDGVVTVGDFSRADTRLTGTGLAMGTVGYMSPEQVRGEKIDARTDIFSFGVVLYEMATGRRAFSGVTAVASQEAILNQTPAPAHERNGAIPSKLELIINRAIEKDRELRYQTAAEMRADLQSVAERPREADDSRPGKHSRWKWQAAAAVVSFAIVGGGLYQHRRSQRLPKLTGQDTIVLADFVNSTGDQVFDGTLKQALGIQLEQSPFLNLLSDDKIAGTLQLMNRPINERMTWETGREVCLRSNSRALLEGTIAVVGKRYLIGLKAINCQTGDTLASSKAEADNRDQVLQALSRAGTQLRENLGESLASVRKYNQPLEQVTTSSLEALQAYTQGRKLSSEQGDSAAVPYFTRAVGLDPTFAIAYEALGRSYGEMVENNLTQQNLTRAYELRDRASRRERFSIESAYYSEVTGEIEKGIQTYTEWIEDYPEDNTPHVRLASSYLTIGQYEKSVAEARQAVRLLPDANAYGSLVEAYRAMNRLQDAKDALEEARKNNIDSYALHQSRFMLAFLQGDIAEMQAQNTWANGKPVVEAVQLLLQSSTDVYHGRMKSAGELQRRAEESAKRSGMRELIPLMKIVHGPVEAEIGDITAARRSVIDGLALTPGRNADVEGPAALTLALLGDVKQAQALVDRMNKEFPLDTLVQGYTLPTIQAVIELRRNNPLQAIELLQALTLELASPTMPPNAYYPGYVRGLAYLQAGQPQRAATEFQKVLDHPGITAPHLQGALARLQLGRAQVMMGDNAAGRESYGRFLALWKDADPDIPIYQQAKAEYAKLQ